jgi:hypothetical protein
MSQSEHDNATTADLASEIAARFAEAIDENRLDDIPDDSLGQLFASVVRAYAAKAQADGAPRPFARNSGVTATDVMIGCSAMLEGVNLQVFELGLWQSWSRVGKRKPEATAQPEAL